MASELIVQNLKGPASGSNANKIIVPSGHTLDASGGTLVPSAGQLVNIQTEVASSTVQVSSHTAFSDAITMSYTPKKVGNLLRITYSGIHEYSGSSGTGTVAQILLNGTRVEEPPNVYDLIGYWSGVSGTANTYNAISYTKHVTAVSGTNTIKYQIRKYSNNGNSVKMNVGWGTSRLTVMEFAQ